MEDMPQEINEFTNEQESKFNVSVDVLLLLLLFILLFGRQC